MAEILIYTNGLSGGLNGSKSFSETMNINKKVTELRLIEKQIINQLAGVLRRTNYE